MMTDAEMKKLIEESNKAAAMTNDELMKKVAQYAVKHTEALSDERMILVEASMRIGQIKSKFCCEHPDDEDHDCCLCGPHT